VEQLTLVPSYEIDAHLGCTTVPQMGYVYLSMDHTIVCVMLALKAMAEFVLVRPPHLRFIAAKSRFLGACCLSSSRPSKDANLTHKSRFFGMWSLILKLSDKKKDERKSSHSKYF